MDQRGDQMKIIEYCIDMKSNKNEIEQRNLSLLKQFTYMHMKGLVMHFQKMVLFIMLCLTNSEILGFEVEQFC